MYLVVGLQGHGTSVWPAANGAPTVCMHGTNAPSSPNTSKTAVPMRVIKRMLTAT